MELKTEALIIPATPANNPRERMNRRVKRVRTLTCSFHMSGTGRKASRKSVRVFTTRLGQQCPVGREGPKRTRIE